MQYLGIDWETRRAAWCALDQHGMLRQGGWPRMRRAEPVGADARRR